MKTTEDVLLELKRQKHNLLLILLGDKPILEGRLASLRREDTSPSLAGEFAENLLLCPSGESVGRCVDRDGIGALSFITIAETAIKALERGDFGTAPGRDENTTPFFLLVSLVMDYLKRSG